jgi:hypothetical protein
MLKKIFFLLAAGLGVLAPLSAQRSFEELFPGFEESGRERVFGDRGFIRSATERAELRFFPAAGSGVDILSPVLNRNPSCLVEFLLVIPAEGKAMDLTALYNALGKIRDLKGRLYHSSTRDEDIPLFEDATRIEGPRKTTPIPDPPPAAMIPQKDEIFIRLKDVNFGNSFYRADISAGDHGVLYRLSNFKNLSYLFIPVMKEEKFIAQFYLEPLAEGVLVYSVAGAEVSDFVASRVDIPSAIRKRLEVIIDWVRHGVEAIP